MSMARRSRRDRRRDLDRNRAAGRARSLRNGARSPTALRFEPIVSVSVRSEDTRLPLPMLALLSDQTDRPAQFVFDQGRLGGAAGMLTLVISGAAPWLERGSDATVARHSSNCAISSAPICARRHGCCRC